MTLTAAEPSATHHPVREVPRILLLSSSPNLLRDDARCRFVFGADEPFDGVIVIDGHDADDVAAVVRRANGWLLPIADLSDAAIPFADVRRRGGSRGRLEEAVDTLIEISVSVRRLPGTIMLADEPETLLLARIHTRGGVLAPVYDARVSHLITYPAAGLIEEPWRHADRLAEAGLLRRSFYDRLHVCPACASSRLNVREECPACRSADLVDETILHHFRCAHQAVERRFRRADKLVCPKCARELRHFGVDYDKPGLATTCRSCGHVDAESAVGFVCIDCSAKHDGEAVPTRDWHDYRIAAAGESALIGGRVCTDKNGPNEALGAFRTIVEQGLRVQTRYGKPVTILRITFAKADEVRRQHGVRALAQARVHALEIVRGEMRDTDLVVDSEDHVLVYMPETDVGRTEPPLRRVTERIRATLRVDLGAHASVVAAEDLSTLLPARP